MPNVRLINVILLLAMFLASVPAPFASDCRVTSHSDVDPCDDLPADACASFDDGRGADHTANDCCDAGCPHCSLPCCAGTAMLGTDSPDPVSQLRAGGCPRPAAIQVAWVDADPLYHPPQI